MIADELASKSKFSRSQSATVESVPMAGVRNHLILVALIHIFIAVNVAQSSAASGSNISDANNTAKLDEQSEGHASTQHSKGLDADVKVDTKQSNRYTEPHTDRSAQANKIGLQASKNIADKQEGSRGDAPEQHENSVSRNSSPLSSIIHDIMSSPFSPMGSRLGMFSSLLLRPSVDFGKSPDGKFLIVRLQMPKSSEENVQKGAQRRVSAALISSSVIQVRVETTSEERTQVTSSQYTLPAHVQSEGMTIGPAEDGTIRIKLRIDDDGSNENEDEGGNGDDSDNPSTKMSESVNDLLSTLLGGSLPQLVPITFRIVSNEGDEEETKGVVEDLPSSAHFDRCRHTYANDKLQLRKCLCDVTPPSSRAVCYSKIIATSVSTARHMNLNDFAVSTKKSAYDCVNDTEDKTQCLERVASQVVKALSHESGNKETEDLKEQIKTALEADDVTATNFYPSSGFVMFQILFAAILLSVCFWGGMVYAMRRGWFGNRSGGLLSHLSSALAQHNVRPHTSSSNLPTKSESSGSKIASRNGLFKAKSINKES